MNEHYMMDSYYDSWKLEDPWEDELEDAFCDKCSQLFKLKDLDENYICELCLEKK